MENNNQPVENNQTSSPDTSVSGEGHVSWFTIGALVVILLVLVVAGIYTSMPGDIPATPVVVDEVVPTPPPVQQSVVFDEGQGIVTVHTTAEFGPYLMTTPFNVPSRLGNTERALYQKISGLCEGSCLETWTPYTTEVVFAGERLRTVSVNEGSERNLVLLDDKMLFTYTEDFDSESTNGLNVDGSWQLAQP